MDIHGHLQTRGETRVEFCRVSLISITWLQRRSRACVSQSEAEVDILVLRSTQNTKNSVEDITFLLLETFRQILSSCFREGVENVSTNPRLRRRSWFSDQPKNINVVKDVEFLLPVTFRQIPFTGSRYEVVNASANEKPGRPSWFNDKPENTNLVKDLVFLALVKFRLITFSCIRGEV